MKRGHTLFDLTREELIAALVEDSIGYLSPRAAELHIDKWERGEKTCCCERCYSVFQTDLHACLKSATTHWQELGAERKRRTVKLVERVSKLDAVSQATAGLMYPTMT